MLKWLSRCSAYNWRSVQGAAHGGHARAVQGRRVRYRANGGDERGYRGAIAGVSEAVVEFLSAGQDPAAFAIRPHSSWRDGGTTLSASKSRTRMKGWSFSSSLASATPMW